MSWWKRLQLRRAVKPRVAAGNSGQLCFEAFEPRAMLADLAYGSVVYGDVASNSEVDTYTFWASENTQVQLGLGSYTGAGFSPNLEVYSPENQRIFQFSPNNTAEVRRVPLLREGTYVVKVKGSKAGSYGLSLERLTAPSADAQRIDRGAVIKGRVDGLLDIDQYTFYGRVNEKADLAIFSSASTDFHVQIEVYSPSGSKVLNLAVEGPSGNSRQGFLPIGEEGVYKILVHDDRYDRAGDYSLSLETVAPSSIDALSIGRGDVLAGSINQPVERDQYRFWIPAQATIQFALQGTPTAGSFVAQAELFTPAGSRLTFLAGNSPQQMSITVQAEGFYVLQVGDASRRWTGNYLIGLEGISPGSLNPVALPRGELVQGSITNAIDKKQFYFGATANQKYRLILSSTAQTAGFRAVARVYFQNGQPVTQISSSSQYVDITNTLAGRYIVQIEDNGLGQLGSFTVGLESIKPPSPNAFVLGYNTTTTLSQTHILQHRVFRFTPSAGQRFSIELRGGDSGGRGGRDDGVFRPQFELFNPLGQSQGGGSANRIFEFDARQAGQYVVVVFDDYFDAIGQFSIRRF